MTLSPRARTAWQTATGDPRNPGGSFQTHMAVGLDDALGDDDDEGGGASALKSFVRWPVHLVSAEIAINRDDPGEATKT